MLLLRCIPPASAGPHLQARIGTMRRTSPPPLSQRSARTCMMRRTSPPPLLQRHARTCMMRRAVGRKRELCAAAWSPEIDDSIRWLGDAAEAPPPSDELRLARRRGGVGGSIRASLSASAAAVAARAEERRLLLPRLRGSTGEATAPPAPPPPLPLPAVADAATPCGARASGGLLGTWCSRVMSSMRPTMSVVETPSVRLNWRYLRAGARGALAPGRPPYTHIPTCLPMDLA